MAISTELEWTELRCLLRDSLLVAEVIGDVDEVEYP